MNTESLQSKVDEYFFDKENKSADELKIMYYFLGAFFPCHRPSSESGVIFKTCEEDLHQIVKNRSGIGSDYSQQRTERNKLFYYIYLFSVPHMRSKLKEIGLDEELFNRKFPDEYIKVRYLDHFVRGFFDARAYVGNIGPLTHIYIDFNYQFLLSLHNILVQFANVQRRNPRGDYLSYGHKDALKIHYFIYRDWDFIQENGLYLPSKQKLFNLDYKADWSIRTNRK